MPPPSPSPTRDEPWMQQQPQGQLSPNRQSEQRRRSSSSSSTAAPPEPKQSTTATYTEQYLRRRRSQQQLVDAACEEKPSPRANGARRMTRRRSSEDASGPSERLNGLAVGQTLENGHLAAAAVPADMAVEKGPTSELIEGAAASAVSGKGIAANGGKLAAMDQDQKAKRVAMVKKRRAPCGRSTVVLALATGVVTLSVAGGVVVCRMYPSSPAADSIQLVAGRAEEILYTLLVDLRNRVKPYAKDVGEVVYAKLLALLTNGGLTNTTRAAESLVNDNLRKWRDSSNHSEVIPVERMCLKLAEDSRDLLRLAALGLIDVLKVSVEWIQAHLKDATELGVQSEVFERARSFLLMAYSFLTEALKQGVGWLKSSLEPVFEWLGMELDVNDVNLPNEQFLAPLAANQAAIQNIAIGVTAQESRALEDVKRFEKRRVTIAFATNSIIGDTRTIALESIVDAKIAAMDSIEECTKELADEYVKAFERALKEFERTSWQLEEESGAGMVVAISKESQAQVDAATSLKRDLTLLEKVVDEKLTQVQALEEGAAHLDESRDEHAYENEPQIKDQATEEERVLEEPASPIQDASHVAPGNKFGNGKEAQPSIEEDPQTADLAADLAVEHSSSEVLAREHVTNEQIEIAVDLTDTDRLTFELAEAPTVEQPSSSRNALEANHASDEGLDIKVKQSIVAEVVVDLEDIVLKAEHAHVNLVKVLDGHTLSEMEASKPGVELEQGARVTAVLKCGTDVKRVVELDAVAAENTGRADQILPDVKTRIATQPKIEQGEGLKEQKTDLVQKEELSRMDEEPLLAADKAITIQKEQMNEEAVPKVDMDVEEAEAVVVEFQRIEEVELVSIRSNFESIEATMDEQTDDDAQQLQTGDFHSEEDAIVAASSKIETLEMESVMVATELEELEQLEQALQEESELVRAEEELRVIAEEEESWQQSEQHSAEGKDFRDDSMSELRTTAKIQESKSTQPDVGSGHRHSGWYSSHGSSAVTLPGHALVQVGLFSVTFLVLAALAAYLLASHRKRVLFARAPRQRKRWQRLADMNESDAEEVVLLPDDSSDEDEGVAALEESSMEVVELVSSVAVKTTVMVSSGGEAADEEEEMSENHEGDEEELDAKEDGVAESVSASTRSQTVVAKRFQTTTDTMDHPATSSSDASADDRDTASVSVTTPPASRLTTPDTSQRARRRRGEIRT